MTSFSLWIPVTGNVRKCYIPYKLSPYILLYLTYKMSFTWGIFTTELDWLILTVKKLNLPPVKQLEPNFENCEQAS